MSTLKHKFSLTSLALILCALFSLMLQQQKNFAAACASRTISKPRPSSSMSAATPPTTIPITTTTTTTTTTQRPTVDFPTYPCSGTYDAWYCLNGGTCFIVKIGESIIYNCECANGFVGPRCDFKELDGSYLPKRPRPMLESASIASGATCALLFMLFICLTLYLRYDQRSKTVDAADGCCDDEEDVCFASSYNSKCRYCNDRRCCGDAPSTATVTFEQLQQYSRSRIGGGGSAGRIMLLRQHIETFPMSFAIKRSTKW